MQTSIDAVGCEFFCWLKNILFYQAEDYVNTCL